MLNLSSIDLIKSIDWEKDNPAIIYLPLSTSYAAPSLSCFDPLHSSGLSQRAKALIEGYAQFDGPRFWNEKKTPSGMELFYLITAQENYYPAPADRLIVHDKENWPYFSELFKGRILIELCSGDMRKTVDWLRAMPKESWPEEIHINDIVGDNIKSARGGLRKIGYDGKIVPVIGDIQQEVFWNKLALGLNGRDAVVLMQGATFNDFLSQEEGKISFLKHSRNLPPNTLFAFSVDNTTHHQTLHNAYAENAPLGPFLLGGAAHHFDANFKVLKTLKRQDQSNMPIPTTFLDRFFEVSSDYSIKGATTSVSIEKDSDPRDDSKYVFMAIGRKNVPGHRDYIGLVDPITKPSEAKMPEEFGKCGHEILHRFPLRWAKFPNANVAFYVTQCRP